jgi:enoyl-CoA hydratase/carnithine racemase
MSSVHVRLHKDILWLILDNPPLNALTIEMLDRLATALRGAMQYEPSLVVVTGMGEKAFSVSVDLLDDTEKQRQDLLRAARGVSEALKALHEQHISTVALVKGAAFAAGVELLSLCDTVIARDDARFRLPSVIDKIFPSAVSTSLPHQIGQANTTRLVQSGETLDAREAFRLGLVDQVLAARRFLLDTEELLTMLAVVGASS